MLDKLQSGADKTVAPVTGMRDEIQARLWRNQAQRNLDVFAKGRQL